MRNIKGLTKLGAMRTLLCCKCAWVEHLQASSKIKWCFRTPSDVLLSDVNASTDIGIFCVQPRHLLVQGKLKGNAA
jgi:hypothetical protein